MRSPWASMTGEILTLTAAWALALGLGDDEVYLACLKQQIFCGIQTGNTELVEELVEHGSGAGAERKRTSMPPSCA